MQYDQPAAVGYQSPPMYAQPGAAVVTSYGPTQPAMQTTQTTVTYQQPYQQPAVVVQPQPTTVVVVGAGCPHCGRGVMQDQFTCPGTALPCCVFCFHCGQGWRTNRTFRKAGRSGICLGIVCFPVGLVCCFLMRERRCSACGYTTSA